MKIGLRAKLSLVALAAIAITACDTDSESPGGDDATTAEAKRPNVLIIITDDQSYPHASAYGSTLVETPAFDQIAEQGFLFEHAYVSAPSCGPSRASLLTGLPFYRLGAASMNHTVWESSLVPVTDRLEDAGYAVGFTGKGWAPGNWSVAGRTTSPTGAEFNDILIDLPGEHIATWDYAANFEAFMDAKDDEPFFFWVGVFEPHRPFDVGIGEGIEVDDDHVPAFLADSEPTRTDMADYAYEIEYQDAHVAKILAMLKARGELDNTLIIATSDNGMAFPRAKATVYDSGTRVPTAIAWPSATNTGVSVTQMVSLLDIAPTILEATGQEVPETLPGISLLPMMEHAEPESVVLDRSGVVFGVERHFPGARPNGAGYPMRAIRTTDYLYIRNYTPDADAVGNHPGPIWPSDDPVGGFGDIDGGLSKTYLWETREENSALADMAFGQRPAVELYDLKTDPEQQSNVADDPEFATVLAQLSEQLDAELKSTGDPRAVGNGAHFDAIMQRYPVEGSNTSE